MAHGILVPGPGNWMSPALAGGFLTNGPGKPLKNSLKYKIGMDGNFHVMHTHTHTHTHSLNPVGSILLNREPQDSFALRSETRKQCYYLDYYLTLFWH